MDRSIMWTYIGQEKEALERLLESGQAKKWAEECRPARFEKVIFLASGSSLNIAQVSRRLYQNVADMEVVLNTPYQFLADVEAEKYNGQHTLVIAISQTGTSNGTINAIKAAKAAGLPVLSMTEQMHTPVQMSGDYYLNFQCGPEACNAKSKGYSSSLVLLWLVALEIGKAKGKLEEAEYTAYMDEIRDSICDIPETMEKTRKWVQEHKDWAAIRHFLVVGTGMNYGTAEEGMLKVMETLCIPGSVCELGEFSHGVHRTICPDSTVITIQTGGYGTEDMEKINQYLRDKITRLLVIDAAGGKPQDDLRICVPCRPRTESALNIAVVFQVLATALPEVLGYDPNRPSNDELTRLVATRN